MDSLDIRRGEQVALVGDNASGKSRLASVFAGRKGAKYITFRDSYGSYGDRNFFMQQRWNLFTLEGDPPSVGEALHQDAAESKDPEAALRRVKELTTLFSMEPLLDKPLVTLSSGELRKYQLTRALLGGPEILVVDNPYIGLDPRTRGLLTELLTTLSGTMTLVLVLSRPAEIPPFITHVIPVEDGKAGEKEPREAYLDRILPPAVIRLRNVTIRFGERVILNSLNWTVREGEHWAALRPPPRHRRDHLGHQAQDRLREPGTAPRLPAGCHRAEHRHERALRHGRPVPEAFRGAAGDCTALDG